MSESPFRIEPAFLEDDVPVELADLAVQLGMESTKLPGRLPPAAAGELAGLVRIMNCYYSNLIEGHHTRPIDIERSMASRAPARDPLVQEAKAHVLVQESIDDAALRNALPRATDVAFIRDVHRRFYEAMPDTLRTTTHGSRMIQVTPGAFRSSPDEDVAVGRHQPPASRHVEAFMCAFEERFGRIRTPGQMILALPAAHHRLAYIHPFVDGNGRVSRLMSHAMALKAGVGAHGLWSISRGLARGLKDRSEYKAMMDAADTPRQGSRDGRGNLSQIALIDFTKWFLEVAIDQVSYCAKAFELDRLGKRYQAHLAIRYGNPRPGALVKAVLEAGEVERGRAGSILNTSERTARTVLATCLAHGFLKSETPKGRVRIGFPVSERAWLFPGLFADDPEPRRPPPLRINDEDSGVGG